MLLQKLKHRFERELVLGVIRRINEHAPTSVQQLFITVHIFDYWLKALGSIE
jgi:hypothetical protein